MLLRAPLSPLNPMVRIAVCKSDRVRAAPLPQCLTFLAGCRSRPGGLLDRPLEADVCPYGVESAHRRGVRGGTSRLSRGATTTGPDAQCALGRECAQCRGNRALTGGRRGWDGLGFG